MTKNSSNSPQLPVEQFRDLVSWSPLVSIDLIIRYAGYVLLGERINRPAQHFWFVPGGRVRKGECLSDAYQRLTLDELGVELSYDSAQSIGVYEHFYNDSVFGETPSTHYVAIGMIVDFSTPVVSFPTDQHDHFSWWPIDQALKSSKVHSYTKDYLHSLLKLDQ